MKITSLIENKRYEDLFILSRFLYRIGKPILSDKIYDKLEKSFIQQGILEDFTSRSYDDDPIPYKLLEEFGLLKLVPEMGSVSPYAKYLDEEKSLSIRAVTDYESAFTYFNGVRGQQLIIMLKGDGINSKSLYIKDILEVSLSRARAGLGFDLTKNICKVIPTVLNLRTEQLKVFSESFVFSSSLEYFRKKYGKDYKTEKSSAISMLRVAHEEKDYKYLESLAFNAEGVPNAKTREDILIALKEQGFSIVPYKIIQPEEVPTDFESFKIWLDGIGKVFFEETKVYPSDGLVVDVNKLDYETNVKNQYADRNIALKLGYWSFNVYYGEIEEIVFEQKRVKTSCRAKIKPIRTNDGCTAKVVNLYNPSVIIEDKLNIGSVIPFVRNSGAVNVYVRNSKSD